MRCISFFFRIFAPAMRKYLLYTTCFFALSLLFSSCNEEVSRIPFCQVSIHIDLRSHDSDFRSPMQVKTFGNQTHIAGCGGVVVINLNGEDFLAFDMSCPDCVWVGGTVIPSQLLARPLPPYFQCSQCNNRFNPLDGRPMQGSDTRYTLRQYQVTIQETDLGGNVLRLTVHN